jgi:RNA polymerase sigma-70 factor (ECF subfamily)
MLLCYKAADGKTHDWEVAEEVGDFYLAALEEEKQNERRETRRHTSLSRFTHEDARYFSGDADMFEEIALAEAALSAMSHLSERQRRLFAAVYIEGWNYTELAAIERRLRGRKKNFKNFFAELPGFALCRGL